MTTVNDGNTIPNQVLSPHIISEEMNFIVSELEPLLPITPGQRQLLLLKFNWDIESLRNSFQEYADMNSFLLENGVCPNNTVSVKEKSECAVCCSTKRLMGLRCQHMACVNCWSEYLTTKIRNGQCLLSCMGFECGMLISDKLLKKFLCGSTSRSYHRNLIRDTYVNSDSSLAWCNKKCGMAVRRKNNDTVTCSCGSTFCFLCSLDSHYPATCRQLRLWEKERMNTDRLTSSWILSNTRECPRCFVQIQKNGGCYHMACTACHYEYCWVCSQNWYYHLEGCKQADITAARSQFNSRGNSHIFAQHLLRFEHHKKCLKQDRRVSSADKLQSTLDECHRILMNSYVFGYYLKDGVYKSSFEKHQQNLDIAVKKLVLYKTGPKSVALKLAEDCLLLQKALLAHCDEGAEHEDLEKRQPDCEKQRKVPLQTTTNTVESASTDTNTFIEFLKETLLCVCVIGLGYCLYKFIYFFCIRK